MKENEIKESLKKVNEERKMAGFKLSSSKTVLMTIMQDDTIVLEGKNLTDQRSNLFRTIDFFRPSHEKRNRQKKKFTPLKLSPDYRTVGGIRL